MAASPFIDTMEGELRFGLSILGRAPVFLAGIAAAWVYVRHGETLQRRLSAIPPLKYLGADLVALSVLVLLAYGLRWTVSIEPLRRAPAYEPWHVVEALLWAAVILLMLTAPLRLKPLLSNSVLNRLGTLSYSIYLLHVPLFAFALRFLRGRLDSLVGWNARTAIVAALLCAVCIALAEVTYRCVEAAVSRPQAEAGLHHRTLIVPFLRSTSFGTRSCRHRPSGAEQHCPLRRLRLRRFARRYEGGPNGGNPVRAPLRSAEAAQKRGPPAAHPMWPWPARREDVIGSQWCFVAAAERNLQRVSS